MTASKFKDRLLFHFVLNYAQARTTGHDIVRVASEYYRSFSLGNYDSTVQFTA